MAGISPKEIIRHVPPFKLLRFRVTRVLKLRQSHTNRNKNIIERTKEKGMTQSRNIKAPHGTNLSCKGWVQEAAMRMLMNNLDPDVAEKPAGADRVRRRRKSRAQLGVLSMRSSGACAIAGER